MSRVNFATGLVFLVVGGFSARLRSSLWCFDSVLAFKRQVLQDGKGKFL